MLSFWFWFLSFFFCPFFSFLSFSSFLFLSRVSSVFSLLFSLSKPIPYTSNPHPSSFHSKLSLISTLHFLSITLPNFCFLISSQLPNHAKDRRSWFLGRQWLKSQEFALIVKYVGHRRDDRLYEEPIGSTKRRSPLWRGDRLFTETVGSSFGPGSFGLGLSGFWA